MVNGDSNECPHVGACELFPRFQSSATLGIWKAMYCQSKHSRCARYQLSEEGKLVPVDLLPDGQRLIQFPNGK
jgi:hypothetical protein